MPRLNFINLNYHLLVGKVRKVRIICIFLLDKCFIYSLPLLRTLLMSILEGKVERIGHVGIDHVGIDHVGIGHVGRIGQIYRISSTVLRLWLGG